MEDVSVFTFAKWQIKEGYFGAVINLLQEVVEESRAEADNLKYQVFKANEDENTLLLFEEYKNREALEFHRASSHFQEIVVRQIVPLLDKREIILASELHPKPSGSGI